MQTRNSNVWYLGLLVAQNRVHGPAVDRKDTIRVYGNARKFWAGNVSRWYSILNDLVFNMGLDCSCFVFP